MNDNEDDRRYDAMIDRNIPDGGTMDKAELREQIARTIESHGLALTWDGMLAGADAILALIPDPEREWTEAMERLKKVAGERRYLLQSRQWGGKMTKGYIELRYQAYIENADETFGEHSEWYLSPGEAVLELENKIEVKE